MKKALLLLCALLLVGSTVAQAKVSSSDAGLPVMGAGKALYGQTGNGYPVRIAEVDSSGLIEIDNGAVGASFSGALTVDGATTFSADPTFTSATTDKPDVTITNTNADAVGVELKFNKNSASPADNDVIGEIQFYSDDSAGTSDLFYEVEVQAEDITTASEDVSVSFQTITAGSLSEALRLEGGNVVTTGTVDSGKLLSEKVVLDTVQTFTDEDATPDVGAYSYFNTNTTTTNITDFDGAGIEDGQIIVVVSKGAITYDVTSSGIKGGTTDIITAAGDVTTFMYDGTDWYVIARMDMSDDLN